MINVALIGFGGIAQAHKAAYLSLMKKGAPVALKAAMDIDPKRFHTSVEINLGKADTEEIEGMNYYTDLEEMLEKEDIQMVDICLPTPLHAKVAADMLNRGYHVLSEKPMARTLELCNEMIASAKKAKGKLMIGQCLRFYPQYVFLKELIDSKKYGKPISGFFERLSGPPIWGWDNWFMDYERSGGCLLDMHIHDLDMIRFLFGEPEWVTCRANHVQSKFDTVHSNLYYSDVPVTAIGDWSLEGVSFRHGYRVGFEKATVVFENNLVTVYPRAGESFIAKLDYDLGGIEGEIDFFANCIITGEENTKNSPESAAITIKLAETLQKSAQNGGEKIKFEGNII